MADGLAVRNLSPLLDNPSLPGSSSGPAMRVVKARPRTSADSDRVRMPTAVADEPPSTVDAQPLTRSAMATPTPTMPATSASTAMPAAIRPAPVGPSREVALTRDVAAVRTTPTHKTRNDTNRNPSGDTP